jgi:inner membrane protein
MDNLCHTLVGAALGEAGLKTRTRFGNPALMIASNLPDLDVLVYATAIPAVSFRRGWTHGLLAQALLPLLLTGALLLLDRWRPQRTEGAPRASAGDLLLLSYTGVLLHVFLDLMNNYGVRLLMPFSARWFYGDTLFIIDLWLLLTLGAGVYWARRRRSRAPARRALLAGALYLGVMIVSARASRAIVMDAWVRAHGTPPHSLMVGPLPITPVSKAIIVDTGDRYVTGTFSWLGERVRFDPAAIPYGRGDALVGRALEDPGMRGVLGWSRFPRFDVAAVPAGEAVTLTDLRFGARLGRTVVIPRSRPE